MPDIVKELHGLRVLVCAQDGAKLETERDGDDLLGAAFSENAAMVAVPVARLHPAFFQLSTRLAGGVTQKFANYRIRLAIVGDVSPWITTSKPFHDFVYESNRGGQLWFVRNMDELESRLAEQ